jgi:hypothetical protein
MSAGYGILGWMSFNHRDHIAAMECGWLSFSKLLDALQREGLIECLRGYYPALGISIHSPSNKRNSRIRASFGVIALCARYSITLDNLSAHFKIQRTKKPRTMPGL